MDTNVETTNNNDISTNNDISQLIALNKLIDDLIVLSSYVRNKELITKDKLLMKLMYETPNDKYAEVIKKDMLNKVNVVEQVDSFYKRLVFVYNSIYLIGIQNLLVSNCFGYQSEVYVLKDLQEILNRAIIVNENRINSNYQSFVDFIKAKLRYILNDNKVGKLAQQALSYYQKMSWIML